MNTDFIAQLDKNDKWQLLNIVDDAQKHNKNRLKHMPKTAINESLIIKCKSEIEICDKLQKALYPYFLKD